MKDSFPYALGLFKMGYCSFALSCRPGAVVMQYTPTRITRKTIRRPLPAQGKASRRTMQRRLQALDALGIPAVAFREARM